jgi:hypothetical protein
LIESQRCNETQNEFKTKPDLLDLAHKTQHS